jgi:tRNA A37 threonylcarbamoyladenosine dehydratase
MRLVAALHDTSSAMISRHYSAYIVDAMDELAAKAVMSLTSVEVVPIGAASGAPR